MSTDWASTLIEVITKPVSLLTDVVDSLAGTPEHERFSNSIKTDVFSESHIRRLDHVSSDVVVRSGSILRVGRFGFWHYGVYIGKDDVVHFTSPHGDTSNDNRVMRTRMAKFLSDAVEFEILAFPSHIIGKPIYTRANTRRRALSRIGKGNYSLFNNNCQHFAFWCKTGLAFSGQTFLVNGGIGNQLKGVSGFAAGSLVDLIKAPDFIENHGVEISRVLFSSNYIPK
ncbi:lecithin retinol acyltransferase family protein [bacterium]|jgi:hypothetical protein|nr:lecithin retinol acyltransferase family protein [bacterium]